MKDSEKDAIRASYFRMKLDPAARAETTYPQWVDRVLVTSGVAPTEDARRLVWELDTAVTAEEIAWLRQQRRDRRDLALGSAGRDQAAVEAVDKAYPSVSVIHMQRLVDLLLQAEPVVVPTKRR